MQQHLLLLNTDETTISSELSTLRQRHDELSTLTEELQSLVASIGLIEREVQGFEQETAKLSHAIEGVNAEATARANACSSCDQDSTSSGLSVEDLQQLVIQKVSRFIWPCLQLLIGIQEVESDSMAMLLEDLEVCTECTLTITPFLNSLPVSGRARGPNTRTRTGQNPRCNSFRDVHQSVLPLGPR